MTKKIETLLNNTSFYKKQNKEHKINKDTQKLQKETTNKHLKW